MVPLVAPTGCSIRYLSIQFFVIKKNKTQKVSPWNNQINQFVRVVFLWTASRFACWYPQQEIPGEIRWANIMTAAELPRYPLDFRLLSGHQWFSREASGNLILLKWTKYISVWWLTYPSETYIKIWVHQLGLWHSQYMESQKNSCSKPPTSMWVYQKVWRPSIQQFLHASVAWVGWILITFLRLIFLQVF